MISGRTGSINSTIENKKSESKCLFFQLVIMSDFAIIVRNATAVPGRSFGGKEEVFKSVGHWEPFSMVSGITNGYPMRIFPDFIKINLYGTFRKS